MKRNHIFITGLTLFLLLAWGCSDGQEEIPSDGGDVKKQEVNLILTSLPLQGSGTVTRSVSRVMDISMGGVPEAGTRATDESKIENLCVFHFAGESEGSSTAKLISKNYVSNSSDGTTVPVALTPSVQGFLYVCANVGDITANFLVSSSTYQDILDTSLSISGQDVFSTSLPMSGCSELFKIEKTTDGVNIALTRMVAKVTFNCDLSTLPNGDTFEITSAKLCNVPQTAKYVSEEKTSTVEVNSYVGIGTLNTAAKTTTYVWYMLENKRGNNTDAKSWTERIEKNAPIGASYIELTGNYTPSGGVVYGATYVIYLGNGTSYTNYDVERNHHYKITSKIKGTNLADLRVTTDTNLSADGLANCYLAGEDEHWYRFNGTVRGNGNADDYAYKMYGLKMLPADGVNIVSTSISDAVVIWETTEGLIKSVEWDESSGCVKFQTGTAKGNALIAVRNTAKEVLWSWHIWRTNGVDLATLNKEHTLDIKTNTERSWYQAIAPTAARKRSLIILDRNIGANFSGNAINIEDNKGVYCLHYQFGRKDPFPAGTTYNVNALCDGDVILYGYRTGAKTEYKILDKVEAASVAGSSAEHALEYTMKNPEIFLHKNSAPFNWIENATVSTNDWKISNCLWGDENLLPITDTNSYIFIDPEPWDGGKTIYDPSPAGWRVASSDIWTGITVTDSKWELLQFSSEIYKDGNWNNGYWVYFNNNQSIKTFFPGSGYRGLNGRLGYAGISGYNWYSSPAGINNAYGCYLCFNSSIVRVVSMSDRAYGFPVRCVKE